MGAIKYILFLILLISIQQVNALTINEIMYYPTQSNYYNEWLEIYNPSDEEIDIANWKLCGDELIEGYIKKSDEETYLNNGTIIPPKGYTIITDGGSGTEVYDNFNVNENAIALHVNSATICTGLHNSNDLIYLTNNNGELIDAISYSNSWGADGNGKSLCKLPDKTGQWQECNPTPGSTNSEYTQEYTISISEFLPDPTGYDDAQMPEGEWIELFNNGNTEIDLTNIMLKDDFGHTITITSTTTYNQTIAPNDYLVVYTNGFSGFLNNEGFERIKLYDPNNILIEEVSYSNSEEGNSWSKLDNSWKTTKPSPGKKNLEEEQEKESIIEIKNIYLGSDNKAKFGDNLRIRIEIYKGDETKTEMETYIEKNNKKISKVTRFNIEEKYSTTEITVPVQIFPNCDLKESTGNYEVVVEGIGTKDKETIKIEGITQELCGKQEIIKTVETSLISENIINEPEEQILSDSTIYESTSKKTERSAIYFFCITLILLLVKTTRKKWTA